MSVTLAAIVFQVVTDIFVWIKNVFEKKKTKKNTFANTYATMFDYSSIFNIIVVSFRTET